MDVQLKLANNGNVKLKAKLLRAIKNLTEEFQFSLDSGKCHLDFSKIFEMLKSIEGKGNSYILFLGATCYNDLQNLNEKDLMGYLWKNNIQCLYDYRIKKILLI